MAKITATQTFLHDRDRFEQGETYDVESALAGYFVQNGWATADGVLRGLGTPPQEVTLDIQNGDHQAASETVGG